jgi:transposase
MVGAKVDKSDSDMAPVLPVGKRPNFSREFRREIVEKTMQPGASASRVALEHGLNANLVFKWRSKHLAEQRRSVPAVPDTQQPVMLPVVIDEPSQPALPAASSDSVIELEFARARVLVRGDASPSVLRVILQSLTR